MSNVEQLLQEVNSELAKNCPTSLEVLNPGLSTTEVENALTQHGLSAQLLYLIPLYTWRNGSSLGGLPQCSWFYRFLSLHEALEHVATMRSAAEMVATLTGDPVGLAAAVKRVLPIMWDGATGYLAIEAGKPGRVVRFDFESLPPCIVISQSFEGFLELIRDAIRESREPRWSGVS